MIHNVLLVYPPIDPEYYMKGANDSPPLGLVVLQNYVKRHLGLDTEIDIIDGEYYSMTEIIQLIESKKYSMIGLQSMMASYNNSLFLLEIAKKNDLITFMGGHHATQLCDAILLNRNSIVDYIIQGDGEEAFAALVQDEPIESIPNLAYYKDGEVKHNFQRNVPLEYGIIDYIEPKVFEQYYRDIGRDLERTEKLISFRSYSHKGCSNRSNSQYCFFCGRADRGVRFKKPADYVRELHYLSTLPNVKYIFEIGDDFLQDEDWLNQVVQLLEVNPIPEHVHLKIFARANRITESIIPILRKLNVDEVAIGFESGSQKILDNINKRATPQDNLDAAKLLFSSGIDTIASFVLGLPGETEETLQETYDAAMAVKELALKYLHKNPQEIIANIIEINPGAPAFRKLARFMPEKYNGKDKLDLYETQNDYFKMEFNLKTDDEVAEFRKKLVKWGNKINNLGNYTYPAGFKSEEVLQDNEHEESENRYSKSS